MAKATQDASDQKAQFEGQMAEAKLAAGDMRCAFEKLTCDYTDQKASFDNHMAKAENDVAEQEASFDRHMARAEHNAVKHKASSFTCAVLSPDSPYL